MVGVFNDLSPRKSVRGIFEADFCAALRADPILSRGIAHSTLTYNDLIAKSACFKIEKRKI